MIYGASDKYNIDLYNSYMVIDTINDIKTGLNAGCKNILVLTGYGADEQKNIKNIKPDLTFNNLLEFS